MESPRDFVKTFERSMAYLGLEYVDLLALHGINHRGLLKWALQSFAGITTGMSPGFGKSA